MKKAHQAKLLEAFAGDTHQSTDTKIAMKDVCSKYVLDFLNQKLLQNSLRLPKHQYVSALAILQ